MAKAHKVFLNKPMLEALKKMIVRQDSCPVCEQDLDMHSSVTITPNGRIIDCSNT